MKAIEFESKVQDGIIKIPENYRGWYGKTVKVILLAEEKDPPRKSKDAFEKLYEFFDQFQEDIARIGFDRDELHER